MIAQFPIGQTRQWTYTPKSSGAALTEAPTISSAVLYDASGTEIEVATTALAAAASITWNIPYNTLTRGTHDWQKGYILLKWAYGDDTFEDIEWVEFPTYDRGDAMVFVSDAKDYLRITHSRDDVYLGRTIDRALSDFTARIGKLIVSKSVTESVEVGPRCSSLCVRNTPIDSGETITITNPYGNEIDEDAFTSHYASGIFKYEREYDEPRFLTEGTWTVTYTGGLDVRPDWTTVESRLAGAMLDYVTHLYTNRNPLASSEKDGPVGTVLMSPILGAAGGWPPRVLAVVDSYRSVVA